MFSANSTFMEIINTAIKEIPADCSIIIISRTSPPSIFARHITNREMDIIDSEELLLSDEDVSGIAKLLGCRLSGNDEVCRIQDIIKGWTAGLVLMTGYIKEGIKRKDKSFGVGHTGRKVLFDYFMREVFKKFNAGTQDFLVKISLFNEITVEMALKLTLNPAGGDILYQLNAGRFFINILNHEDAIYQYHPMFREFLQSYAKGRFNKDEWREITATAAYVLKDAGFPENAAHLFIKAEKWPGLKEVISEQSELLLSQGRYNVLESWITSVPAEVMNQSPRLLYYLGMCLMSADPEKARSSLESAYRLFKTAGDAASIFEAWSGIVETYLYEWKAFKPLDRYLQDIEGIIAAYPDFPTRGIEERTVSAIFSAMMFRQPQNPAIAYWEGRALDIIQNSKDINRKLMVGHTIILYYLWLGRIAKASVVLDIVSQAYNTSVSHYLPHLFWLRSVAMYYVYTAQLKKSMDMTDECLRIVEKTGIQLLNVMFYGTGIYNSVLLGDKDSAKKYSQKLTAEMDKIRSYSRVFYHHQMSNIAMHLAMFTSDINCALEHAEECVRHSEELGGPLMLNFHRYVLALYRLEAGKSVSLKGDIAEIRRTGKAVNSIFHEYLCLLLEAMSAMMKARRSIFCDKFRGAMALSKTTGISIFMLTTLPTAARLCAEGIEVPHVRELIRLNNLTAYYTPSPDVLDWPWDIKIYTLGRFEIWVDNKKVEFSGKVQKKPLSLLKMLIAAGGKGAAEEDVIDSLWPDSDGDQANQAFSMALCRLRRLIGSDKTVIYNNSRLAIDRQHCWVDTWGFNHLLKQSEDIDAGGKAGRGIPCIQKAITMYVGHFLPGDIKEPWTLSQRERLRDRFITAISRLGQYHEKRGVTDNAIACYNKGIEIDELAEKLYQRLMLCLQRTGNSTEAVRTFKRLKTLLSIHLGIEPSRETAEIYKAILAG
ncbi:MAG: hypothetical protein HZA08_09640 [Nitrospirae bacterium]|nr:hypothetical protein [Nitrospirota bacterium]